MVKPQITLTFTFKYLDAVEQIRLINRCWGSLDDKNISIILSIEFPDFKRWKRNKKDKDKKGSYLNGCPFCL